MKQPVPVTAYVHLGVRRVQIQEAVLGTRCIRSAVVQYSNMIRSPLRHLFETIFVRYMQDSLVEAEVNAGASSCLASSKMCVHLLNVIC